MSAINDMSKWLDTIEPRPEERKILRKIILYCKTLQLSDEHIKSIMHKSGLTQ